MHNANSGVKTPLGTVWELRTDFYPYAAPSDLWDALGLIPYWLDVRDFRPAVDQIGDGYGYGWHTLSGFSLVDGVALKYPYDPLMYPLATCAFRAAAIMVYPHSFVCVSAPGHAFKVARVD